MSKKSVQAIVDALDRLGRGAPTNSNGKLNAVNLAAEAGISKATLYRYFEQDEDLRNDYEAMRKRGMRRNNNAPATVQEALKVAQEEILELRRQLKDAEKSGKVKAQQILLLWTENKRLKGLVSGATPTKAENVATFPPRKR